MEDSATALEQFRQQWKEEVDARAKKSKSRPTDASNNGRARRPSETTLERPLNRPPNRHPAADVKEDSEHDSAVEQSGGNSSDLNHRVEALSLRDVDEDEFSIKPPVAEPETALEHFEKAIEREDAGKLGDSLAHYRKAYKLDAKVDQKYKNKHFPVKSKPNNPNPSNAPVTVPGTGHHSSGASSVALNVTELIQSYAGEVIIGASPLIERDIPPPCTIQKLPNEVLNHMLTLIGLKDPALLVRLSLVCKKLAYHVFTENTVWKRIALGHEFGLLGQQYEFATDVQGREVIYEALGENLEKSLPPVSELFFPRETVWRDLFHSYPRIRFSGVYISTVNYTRPGGASANQVTWASPVHIVTYYRYLRFFRDGTCISLLTTNEPLEVVHHLTPENLNLVRSKGNFVHHPLNFTSSAPALQHSSGQTAPPSAQNLLKHALRGRWRMSHPSLSSATETTDPPSHATMLPGDLHIETEGAGPRYIYTMHLSLKSSSRSSTASKNTKLIWKGFWSYNSLTSDWAEFGLKNDKPFWFSRVKSYGLGC